MTIQEAIDKTDGLKHNTFDDCEKIRWLHLLDSRVCEKLIKTHEGRNRLFQGYDTDTDRDTVLLIPSGHDELYLLWLLAQIDYYNGEIERYNNSITRFNEAWTDYANYYNRTHMPKAVRFQFF